MTERVIIGQVRSFDKDKREIQAQVVPWDTDALTNRGYERFSKGAFEGIDPGRFVLRQRHQDPPTGRGIEIEEADDWLLMTFKVARTAAGDDQLALLEDGVETGVSVGFEDGEILREKAEDGKTRLTHKRVNPDGMLEVSTTYIPAFREAAVLQTRESEVTEPTTTEAVEKPAVVTFDRSLLADLEDKLVNRIDRLEEKQAAMLLSAPQQGDVKAQLKREVVLQIRELEDVITTGNEGVLPETLSSTILGRVDAGRPFLNSTLQVPAPPSGMNLNYPVLTTGPEVDTQESEKAELASRATAITTTDFGLITIGGAGDLSMQLIKRSSPSFLELWLSLLGDALAIDADDKAVDALLAESAVVEGGEFDPAVPTFGEAFTNAVSATGRTMKPDRIWLSTAAAAAFMDAVEPSGGGGRPLYPGIAGIAGNGGAGTLGTNIDFSLTPVWVPALDDESVDLIIGPSRAFAWAEDGAYQLAADVPSKFGRDIGIATMIWYAPLYPAAFTSYTLGS